MTLKVKFVSDAELDSASHELLRKFAQFDNCTLTPPIPIEGLIERYLKLDFGFTDLKSMLGMPDVLGATWFNEKRIRIDSTLENEQGRASFTMAHEVAHWFLHRPQYEANKLTLPLIALDATEKAEGIACRSGDRQPAEWQADQFAACLLMPPKMLRDAYRKTIGEPTAVPGLASARKLRTVPNEWRAAAATMVSDGGFTNVSIEAMRYRLEALRLVVDADEVASRLL